MVLQIWECGGGSLLIISNSYTSFCCLRSSSGRTDLSVHFQITWHTTI